MKKKRIYNHILSREQKTFLNNVVKSDLLDDFVKIGEFYDFQTSHNLEELKADRLQVWHVDIKDKIYYVLNKPTYCDMDRRFLNSIREYYYHKDEILKLES